MGQTESTWWVVGDIKCRQRSREGVWRRNSEKGLEGQRPMEPGWETPEQACLPKRRTTAWENLVMEADRVTAEAAYFGRRGDGSRGGRVTFLKGRCPPPMPAWSWVQRLQLQRHVGCRAGEAERESVGKGKSERFQSTMFESHAEKLCCIILLYATLCQNCDNSCAIQ